MALDLAEAGRAQPLELLGEVGEAVARVVLVATDLAAKALVQRGGRGTDQVEVGEDAAGGEQHRDFREQLALAAVLEVMDREAGDDDVERPVLLQRQREIVRAQLDRRVIAEPRPRALEHRRGGVEADRPRPGVGAANQRDQPSVPGPQVEHSLHPFGQRLEQHPLRRPPVRYLPPEVPGDPLSLRPLAGRHRIRSATVDVNHRENSSTSSAVRLGFGCLHEGYLPDRLTSAVPPNVSPAGLFIGLTTFDLVHYVERFPRADEKIQARARWTGAGGPAANAAAAFAALGGRAILVTAVGNGSMAGAVSEDLAKLEVEVVDLARYGELPTSSAVVDDSGQRTVVSLNAKGFDPAAMADRVGQGLSADVVVIDSHYPAVVDAVLGEIQGSVPIVFDPGGYKPHVFDMMEMCDHVIASRSLDSEASADALLERIMSHDVELAAVSRGAESIVAVVDGRRVELEVPQVTARDTVGAGDVLHGAYAYFLSVGCPIEEALERAATVAADSCERHGARVVAQTP